MLMTISYAPSVPSRHTTFTLLAIAEMTLPAGSAEVEVMKGFEYRFERQTVSITAGRTSSLTIHLQPLDLPKEAGSQWVSGDVHVHMNYGGAYRNTPKHLVAQAAAENLQIVEDLVVNKEQRIPDIAYFSPKPDPASTATNLLLHGQEFHTSYWGHLGLLNLTRTFSSARLRRLSQHCRRQLISRQRKCGGHGACNNTRWWDMFILMMQCPIQSRMLR